MSRLTPVWVQRWVAGLRSCFRKPRIVSRKPPRISSCSRCRRQITKKPPNDTGTSVRNRIDSKLSDVKNGDLSNWRRPVVRTMIGLFVIRCAFGMHSLVHLSRASARMTPPQQQGLSAVEGKRMFESTCVNSYCHAEDGRGSGPTNLQNRHFTPTQVTQIISNGVPGTSMPEWKTTYDQEQ